MEALQGNRQSNPKHLLFGEEVKANTPTAFLVGENPPEAKEVR